MATHHHHEDESYYLDQLCMIALSGAFGAVCLSMYFWQKRMLGLLLDPKFFPFILVSGILLTTLAVIRALLLWREVGEERTAPHGGHGHGGHEHGGHEHEGHSHSHGHGHDHADHAGHAHSHGGETCSHAHGADHADHGHSHGHGAGGHDHAGHSHSHGGEPALAEAALQPPHQDHDHDEADHEHGWAPWRYVLVLTPIILFLLGLPNKGPQVKAGEVDSTFEKLRAVEAFVSTIPGFAPLPVNFFGFAAQQLDAASIGDAPQVGYKELEGFARDEALRNRWKGQMVKVKGQFSPDPRSLTRFNLARFSINCCAADAIALNVPMLSAEPITHVNRGDWIEVTGRVDFLKTGDSFRTVLMTPGVKGVNPCNPDANPYVN